MKNASWVPLLQAFFILFFFFPCTFLTDTVCIAGPKLLSPRTKLFWTSRRYLKEIKKQLTRDLIEAWALFPQILIETTDWPFAGTDQGTPVQHLNSISSFLSRGMLKNHHACSYCWAGYIRYFHVHSLWKPASCIYVRKLSFSKKNLGQLDAYNSLLTFETLVHCEKSECESSVLGGGRCLLASEGCWENCKAFSFVLVTNISFTEYVFKCTGLNRKKGKALEDKAPRNNFDTLFIHQKQI